MTTDPNQQHPRIRFTGGEIDALVSAHSFEPPRMPPSRATSDRHAIAAALQGEGPVNRIRNVRARMAVIRQQAADFHAARQKRLEPKGFTWRGWWYSRGLVLGLLWVGIGVLAIALGTGIAALFGGAA